MDSLQLRNAIEYAECGWPCLPIHGIRDGDCAKFRGPGAIPAEGAAA